MVNRNLIREFDVTEEDWSAALGTALEESSDWFEGEDVSINQIVEGKIIRVDDEFVVVDVGYKSEGIIERDEWEEGEPPPEPGQEVSVLVEEVEDVFGRHDDRGMIVLSKRKAEKIKQWQEVMESVAEGDVVTGEAIRKIKGGLLVDIGVNVFLPASQVDIRRPPDIGEYIGKKIDCIVLKIDEARRNIVVSRRSLIEQERAKKKAELLKELEINQLRKGVVKNIADFGAFVDLGGIDGLLHITDMSWGRINHPSEMVSIDDELEVVILHIDYDKEKIALGLKQKSPSPWDGVEEKYPVNSTVKGTVVNVMSYGAFVQASKPGIEGLVHISEMSWVETHQPPQRRWFQIKRRNRRVQVLGINKRKAGNLARHEAEPAEPLGQKSKPSYPVGNERQRSSVRNLTNYGAFIETRRRHRRACCTFQRRLLDT